MARGKRTARTAAWFNRQHPARRSAAPARQDRREILRKIEQRNLAATRAHVRTMPPGGPLEPYVPAPARARTIWEAATGTPLHF